MIKLTIYPSNKNYYYKTKTSALNDIKSNGLKSNNYTLKDTINNTYYKGGLWLNNKELSMYEDGISIKQIKIFRNLKKGGKNN